MLIIFDYFGVLAQDGFWYESKATATVHHKGKHLASLNRKSDLGEISWSDYCGAVAKDLKLPTEQVMKQYQDHKINTSVVRLAHSLKEKGYTIVLLSNASSEYLLPIMKKLGLDALFDKIFVSSDIHLAKPDPLAYEYVLNEMGFEPYEAVMIDDSQHNVDSAISVGMRGIVYKAGETLII